MKRGRQYQMPLRRCVVHFPTTCQMVIVGVYGTELSYTGLAALVCISLPVV